MRTHLFLAALALCLAQPAPADDSIVVTGTGCGTSEGAASEAGAATGEQSDALRPDGAECASIPAAAPDGVSDQQATHALEVELVRNIGKQTRESDYPREARQMGWSGTTLVQVVVGADGTMKRVSVGHTSGFQVLDEQALRMVMRAPPARVPDQLKGREVTLTVPIGFYFVSQ
ncbi:MAG TPA: energy transducer TonB [Burkholderiales bacterium]|nr:energy transducer TonB [Burkholderiales bacterium]